MHLRLFAAALLVCLVAAPLPPRAQTPRTATPSAPFAAASVKPNKSTTAASFVGAQPGGRFRAENASLRELIEYAYDVQPFRLLNSVAWVDADRWNIAASLHDASSAATDSSGQRDAMLSAVRELLAARFNLTVRRDTRELPIYALVLARADHALGAQLKASTIDCTALFDALSRGARPSTTGPPVGSNGAPACTVLGRVDSLRSGGTPLIGLADSLSTRVQRVVVDRTGLGGAWEFTLAYTPETSQIPRGALASGDAPPVSDATGPSIFTALQEQLGLKLESTRGPVQVLVVDRVDPATPD